MARRKDDGGNVDITIPSKALKSDDDDTSTMNAEERRVVAQLKNETGELLGSTFDLPLSVTASTLQQICNALLRQDETTPYSFFVDDVEISDSLGRALAESKTPQSSEAVVQIVYQAQAVFRVRAVTRCTSTVEGHAEPVLTLQFSPNARYHKC